jgi:hypothetical protein
VDALVASKKDDDSVNEDKEAYTKDVFDLFGTATANRSTCSKPLHGVACVTALTAYSCVVTYALICMKAELGGIASNKFVLVGKVIMPILGYKFLV